MTEAEARALRQENAALLTRDGFVTDEGSGYKAVPGMHVRIVEAV